MARFLSFELPKVLSTLVDKLNSKDRLTCENVVSAGGYMPIWEVNTRMKIESRTWKKSLDSMDEKLSRQNGANNGKNINFQDISEDYEDSEDYEEEDEDDEDYYGQILHFFCIPAVTEKKNPYYAYLDLLSRFPPIIQVLRKNLKKKHNSIF